MLLSMRKKVDGLFVGEKEDGVEWRFLCIQCVRDWRQRGLKREGLSDEEIGKQLDREYPIAQRN